MSFQHICRRRSTQLKDESAFTVSQEFSKKGLDGFDSVLCCFFETAAAALSLSRPA